MIKLKFGNTKLGNDTLILNMGPAETCPSKKKGYCEVINKGITCYAYKAERCYKRATPAYRRAQEEYWKTTPAKQILADIIGRLEKRKIKTRFFRFNESGDFYTQRDVRKLSTIAEGLKARGITTYGYTARRDLDFKGAKFLVKGSGHSKGNNGRTTVLDKGEQPPRGYIICPGSCKTCNICKEDTKTNIAFRKH